MGPATDNFLRSFLRRFEIRYQGTISIHLNPSPSARMGLFNWYGCAFALGIIIYTSIHSPLYQDDPIISTTANSNSVYGTSPHFIYNLALWTTVQLTTNWRIYTYVETTTTSTCGIGLRNRNTGLRSRSLDMAMGLMCKACLLTPQHFLPLLWPSYPRPFFFFFFFHSFVGCVAIHIVVLVVIAFPSLASIHACLTL